MTGSDIRQQIRRQRQELATMLAGLSAEDWDADSLCAGWRVRELVAHMVMPFRYSAPQFMGRLILARGDFNKMADVSARRDAATLSSAELAAAVRDNIDHPWKPPGGGLEGALSHDLIHGLDMTVPLGIDWQLPKDRLRMVLVGGMSPRSLKFFGTDLSGVQLRADDLDWSYGNGAPIHGAAQDLLLAVSGRRLPAGRLRGDGLARLVTSPARG